MVYKVYVVCIGSKEHVFVLLGFSSDGHEWTDGQSSGSFFKRSN
jgi:hypothetical protein